MQRPWKKAARWLARPAIAHRTISPGLAPATLSWTLPRQLSVQKSKTLARVVRSFTNGAFLSHSDYSLCQGDKTSRIPTRH